MYLDKFNVSSDMKQQEKIKEPEEIIKNDIPEILEVPNQSEEVLNFIKTYYSENKRFPSQSIIANNFKISISQTSKIIKSLYKTNKIKRRKNYYYLAGTLKRQKAKKEIKKEELVKNENIIITFLKFLKSRIDMDLLFKIILFIVFVDFIFIGIKYLYFGMLKYKDNIDALSCAIAFMLIAVVFFKMFFIELQKKNPLCIFYGLLYIIIFLYNTTTLSVYFYEKYQDKLYSQEKIQTKKDNFIFNDLETQIKTIEKEIFSLEEEKNRQMKILIPMEKSDLKYNFYYWNINNKETGFLAKIEKKNMELNKLKQDRNKLLLNSEIIQTEKKELLPNWLMKIYLFFPAFIIDFLASMSLVLLFQKKKEE